jgi:hypothetical protein
VFFGIISQAVPVEFNRVPHFVTLIVGILLLSDFFFRVGRHPRGGRLTILEVNNGFKIHRLAFLLDFEILVNQGLLDIAFHLSTQYLPAQELRSVHSRLDSRTPLLK